MVLREDEPRTQPDWHAIGIARACNELNSNENGLTHDEAERRLARHGPNLLPRARPPHPLLRFLAQFNNALIYFLLASALAAFFLDHAIDAGVILAVVLINALVGVIQEGRAEKALAGMENLIGEQAHVLREGHRQAIAADTLVPGDIVVIEAGDRVAADLRIARARALSIEEATLTGESVAAEKHADPVSREAPLAERSSMAFSGTLVVRGQGTGLVVATGTATEIGKIGTLIQSVPRLVTPLLRQIDHFGTRLTLLILAGSIALFAFAVGARGYPWVDALIAVVALAVGAIPEGLPAVITITLAIGVQRMAQRRAVIRKLPAVETLGATSVICTDKTGTLTRNEMTVTRLFVPQGEWQVSGDGYAPEGTIVATTDLAPADPDAVSAAPYRDIARCAALCNDGRLAQGEDGQWQVVGDPMDGAVLALAAKAGLDGLSRDAAWERLDAIPFDAAYRFMATLHRTPERACIAYIKGAPEAILALCSDTTDVAHWKAIVEDAASQGERLLGFASLALPEGTVRLAMTDLAGARMLGLMAFVDPPRPEARSAIAQCRSAGIAVKMITGDHAATALAIARDLEIEDQPRALTGAQIEAMSEDELHEEVPGTCVFARASPEHKLRIVRALQAHGLIVAMTGDGVNDAPSLRQADVGTAMGASGTQAAREAAQMVLLDDNFASIVAAVREGRTVYDNIRKVIAWTLPTNGGEIIAVVLAIIFDLALPMSATQILWINLVTSVTLGLVLAFEPAEPGIMKRAPRGRDAPLLSGFIVWRVLLVSVLFAVALLGVYAGALRLGADIATTRTMVVNMLVIAEIFYLFNVRYLHVQSLSWQGLLGTRAVLVAVALVTLAQFAFTYLPAFQTIFDTRPLSLFEGLILVAIGAAIFILLEAEKALMRRLGWFAELA
ncbi:HAD-IC family P-type ATPase [Novosphingobium profundi]|uniref:cation-translocating P-type ATPase n=1 Tax=Novosphingobium profundi TaxID=1774954 RepID=UPI001BDB619B|nr:HAD-IC family P-type ATPase [Novosphingobium profundi]MBT0671525.1 HAD-IC family P-type ATPase [Novosphingobium profundi]